MPELSQTEREAQRTRNTNREILERIKADLNELIDVRGNKHMVGTLIDVQGYLDEVADLERLIDSFGGDDV